MTATTPSSSAALERPLLVVPTYCEAASLPELLGAVLALPHSLHVLVVDDNSSDGTAEIVRRHPEYGRRVFLDWRPCKLGHGSAYRDGFAWAMQNGYTVIIEMDADLSHDPRDIPRLLHTIGEGADLAVGSRYLDGINVIRWPLSRLLLSLGAGMFARGITGLTLTDPTSGFKALRREVVRRLDWRQIRAEGYGFHIAVNFFAQRAGLRSREISIVFTERRNGQSKFSAAIAVEAAGIVLKLGCIRLRDLFFRRPQESTSGEGKGV